MKTSTVMLHFKSSFEFSIEREFCVRSFMSELNESLKDHTSLKNTKLYSVGFLRTEMMLYLPKLR